MSDERGRGGDIELLKGEGGRCSGAEWESKDFKCTEEAILARDWLNSTLSLIFGRVQKCVSGLFYRTKLDFLNFRADFERCL